MREKITDILLTCFIIGVGLGAILLALFDDAISEYINLKYEARYVKTERHGTQRVFVERGVEP